MTFINRITLNLINKILSNNESSLQLLQQYCNKSFSINVASILNISAIITHDGYLSYIGNTEFTTSVEIPVSIASSLIMNEQLKAIKHLQIHGDKQFALAILKILSNLHLEITPKTHSISAIMLQNTLDKFIKIIKNTLFLILNNAGQSTSEYLQFETMDIVNTYEIEKFCNDVDELKARVELFEKKLI